MKRDLLKNKEDFYLNIHADENNLGQIRDFISEICSRAGFNKRETNNTKLAVDEACTNIIKHAYSGKAGDIKVHVEAEPGRVDIHLYDKGQSFDLSKIEDPDLEEYVAMGKKGGLGIFLMNRLMDDLDYSPSADGNHLYMAKFAQSRTAQKEPLFVSIKPKWTQTLRFKFLMRASSGLLGLMAVIWLIQFVNLTREIEGEKSKAWMRIRNYARSLELRSENALVLSDPYDPEYRKLSEFIKDGIGSYPPIRYMKVINNDGVIVSSDDVSEFETRYDVPDEAKNPPENGLWLSGLGVDGDLKEYHLPVILSEKDTDKKVDMGHIIVGVSSKVIDDSVEDARFRNTTIIFGVFLAGVGLIYLLVAIFVKPIQVLTDGVRAIGEGSLEDELDIKGPKEIGAIAKAFNEITAKFREAQESVVEQERMYKEMQVAQEIQHSLLPRNVPEISGYDIASYYKAAKEVGGDYYDFMQVDEDTLGVVVADVSGKGVPGSLVMTMIRTALRMEARGNRSAADVMSKMNEFVTDDMKKGMFVTIFYVILDSRNRVISYASAGHNPMILFRSETRETFFLNPRGFPVGINLPDDKLFEKSIDVEKIKLKKDDMLVIYTDGVTEAMNEVREQYGEERLLELIRENGTKSPQEFIDLLSDEIAGFTGDYPQNDDITVVAFKEKYMADEVLFGLRKRLLDLVSVEGLTVAEACSRMNVSPSTYYRYKKRLEVMGERGLKNKELRKEHDIRRLSNEQRERVLEIVEEDPRFGPKRIAARLNESRAKKDRVNHTLVYEELKRMRLNTFEKRLEYLRRNRKITEEEFRELSAGKQVKKPKEMDVEGEKGFSGVSSGEIEKGIQEETAEKEEIPLSASEVVEEEGVREPVAASGPPDEPYAFETVEGREEIAEEDITEIGSAISITKSDADDEIAIVRASGHLDSSSTGELETVIEGLYDSGVDRIIVDLKEVSYISSGGWGIIVGRVKALREREGDVVLSAMEPEVYDVFELLGFRDIIMQFRTEKEAAEFLLLPFKERLKKLKVKEKARKRDRIPEKSSKREVTAFPDHDVSPLRIKAGSVGDKGEITVLELSGIIDTVSCLMLNENLDRIISKGNNKIIADMSRVEYVSSAGWGVFASRVESLRKDEGDIKIFGMDSEVNNVFKLLEFDTIMRSFSILAEAVEDFKIPIETRRDLFTGTENEKVSDEPKPLVELKESSEFQISTSSLETSGGGKRGILLEIEGTLDASTTDRFESILIDSAQEDTRFMILDLSGVVYISSSGWGVIAKYVQELGKSGMELVLAGMSQPIFKIFTDLGFEPLIRHFINVERARVDLSAVVFDEAEYPEEKPDVEAKVVSEEIPAPPSEGVSKDDKASSEERGGSGDIVYSPDISRDKHITSVSAKGMGGGAKGEEFVNADDETFVSDIDIENGKIDRSESKDVNIRKIGWDNYGKKLFRRNKEKKPDKE